MKEHFAGLIAAPHTAMHADGSLNLGMIEKQDQCLINNGVSGAFVCGSTGEGISLSTSERVQVVERWKDVVGGTLPIIVQVGHHSLAEAKALAEHAQNKVGARAIASLAPSYFKPRRLEDLISFCAEVAAPLFHDIIRAFEAGDMSGAQAGQRRARELVAVLIEFGSLTAIKAAMKAIGIDCGPCRLPLRTLSDREYEQFYGRLDEIGFFTYCSKVNS